MSLLTSVGTIALRAGSLKAWLHRYAPVLQALTELIDSIAMIEKMEGRVRELAEYMSELSEEAYEAVWMDGLEFALWYAVENGPKKYGRLKIVEEHINTLKRLSDSVGGWVYFDDKSEETFIRIENWLARYNENIEGYGNRIS